MSLAPSVKPELCAEVAQADDWKVSRRIGFRFCVLYFGLYCLLTQVWGGLIPIPNFDIPDLGGLTPSRQLVFWTAEHIFQYHQPLVYTGSGSGDKVFDWVQAACFLTFAIAGTCIWTALDRRRTHYKTLYHWFRVFLRFAVAGQLFGYGLVKVLPMQMPFPYLTRLIEPFGNFSPMGILWYSVGASPAYERFVGSAELLAGLLLVIPVSSMVGAIICLFDMVEVFALNMTYDVPVKLFSFHLLLMAILLLLPERSRLARFCFSNYAVEAPATAKFFAGRRSSLIAETVQILFGLALFGATLYGTEQGWYKWGGGVPKSPFFGIWNVERMTIDGIARSPLLTDYDRWRRVVFEFPDAVTFQRMDDSFTQFGAKLDAKLNKLVLTKGNDAKWKGQLEVRRLSVDHMTLEGEMGTHKVRMQAILMDRNRFLLVSRGFHWIQDYPFNR